MFVLCQSQTEEGRVPGGWIFVQDWLLPNLLYKSYTFEGAIILGPILNISSEGNRTNEQLKAVSFSWFFMLPT